VVHEHSAFICVDPLDLRDPRAIAFSDIALLTASLPCVMEGRVPAIASRHGKFPH
jgi:hypothetical protein